MNRAVELAGRFSALHGETPRVFRAPGRVNLIGEHTDYNDGFVMPAAIHFSTWIAAAPRADRTLAMQSVDFDERREFSLDEPNPKALNHWSDYVRGVAVILERAGHRLRGTNLMVRGEVPIGSGLSSSAAIEVAAASALLAVSGIEVPKTQLAQLCQRAENEFVGMRCGIMDQFISCHGRAGHALMLDCRSLEFRLAPLPVGVTLVICNTMVHHELAAGEYNKRRADCEMGVQLLKRALPHITALRDVTPQDLERFGHALPETIYRRCRHIIGENARVERAALALEQGDLEMFGKLMGESHASLRDDFEVSCTELDVMVEAAVKADGVYGARMTGGGFGGCTINLVASERVGEFEACVAHEYRAVTGTTPVIYKTDAVNGAEEVVLT